MSSSVDYIEFVRDCLSPFCRPYFRKMFGDYGVYADGKLIALVCDDCFYVKMLPELESILADAPRGFPYEGAKERLMPDIEDPKLLARLVPLLLELSEPPKKRKKKA